MNLIGNRVVDGGTKTRASAGGDDVFDVAILGGGIGGSMLAALCARHGVRVLLAEAQMHPRMTIGESTIPQTAALYRVIGARYDVPEIDHLGKFSSVRQHVSLNCGVKRGFSFVYHRPGQEPQPKECTALPTLTPPVGPDIHFYRQDIDQYMFQTAIKYGAVGRMLLKIDNIERGGPGWLLTSSKGQQFKAKYIVDAGGMNSPMSQKFGLREEPCRMHTNTRSSYAHMIGVTPYDQVGPSRREHGLLYPMHETTLHHIFDGGWIWVIPFDNHPDSLNPVCSVGFTLDRGKYPDDARPPAEEFAELLQKFPGIAKQFKTAHLVRDWVKVSSRLQWSSRQVVGYRYALLPHAAGFIDPLFSTGLAMTVTFVGSIAARLIEAARADDFSTKRFYYLEGWTQRTLDHLDRLVHYSYTSWADFDLWNAWFRVWALGNILGALGPITLYLRYQQDRDPALLAEVEKPPYRGLAGADLEEYMHVFHESAARIDAFRAGGLSAKEAAAQIFQLVSECPLSPPQVRIGDPEQRSLSAWTLPQMIRVWTWGRFFAPKKVRMLYFQIKTFTYPTYVLRDVRTQLAKSARISWALIRDIGSPFNLEWKHRRYNPVADARSVPMLPGELYKELDVPYQPHMQKETAPPPAVERTQPTVQPS
jgi:tetracycline 7-halogenase / FADH2 O2-dependent halogenase